MPMPHPVPKTVPVEPAQPSFSATLTAVMRGHEDRCHGKHDHARYDALHRFGHDDLLAKHLHEEILGDLQSDAGRGRPSEVAVMIRNTLTQLPANVGRALFF